MLPKLVPIILILCNTIPALVENTKASNEISEKQDRLLIDEVQSLEEDIDNINAALEEGNYTKAGEQIDSIRSGESWLNIKKELELRNEVDLISRFNNSLSTAQATFASGNLSSIEQTHLLSEDLNTIIQALGNPVIDVQRLVLTISILSILIAFGLYVIPKIRRKFNVKY